MTKKADLKKQPASKTSQKKQNKMSENLSNIIFAAKFPNIFFLEKNIGDFQMSIIDNFTESSLLYQRGFFISAGTDAKKIKQQIEDRMESKENEIKKIWQFKSEDYTVNISTDSISIQSDKVKTYNDDGFRKTIKYISDNFVNAIKIPFFSRVGLRFIYDFDSTSLENPFEKYKLSSVSERFGFGKINKTQISIEYNDEVGGIYREKIQKNTDKFHLNIDIDAYSLKIKTGDVLETTDKLFSEIDSQIKLTTQQK